MTAGNTRERILDAAEALFAEHGFDGTSLRTITGEAGVHLAAVNYHFGSKQGLVAAVLARILGPINDERLRRLDAVEAGGPVASVPAVLEAFLLPPLAAWEHQHEEQGARRMRLLARLYGGAPPELREVLFAQFGEVFRRFRAAFGKALPHLPEAELSWRIHLVVGAMVHALHVASDRGLCATIEGTSGRPPLDAASALARLVPFLAAGLEAPAATAATTQPAGREEP
jgi:AcrR family transcriptional regulator